LDCTVLYIHGCQSPFDDSVGLSTEDDEDVRGREKLLVEEEDEDVLRLLSGVLGSAVSCSDPISMIVMILLILRLLARLWL
jgi:hypothetical protein